MAESAMNRTSIRLVTGSWGVGKGVTIDNRDTLVLSGSTTRQRKPWYDDVFPQQLYIPGHLLAERYSQHTVSFIKTSLESKIIISRNYGSPSEI